MLVLSIILLLGLFLLFFISRGCEAEFIKQCVKKEHSLRILYPMAAYLHKKAAPFLAEEKRKRGISRFKRLHPAYDGAKAYKLYLMQRDAMIIFLIILILFLIFFLQFFSMNKESTMQENKIKRPEWGSNKVGLQFKAGNLEESLDLSIQSKRLQGEELSSYLSEQEERLLKAMLLENESADCITKDLNFIIEIPEGGLTIEWKPEDYNLIGPTGRVYNKDIDKEGVITVIHVTICYYDEIADEFAVPVRIYPPVLSENQMLYNQILDDVERSAEESLYEGFISLPEKVMDTSVEWSEREESYGGIILMLGALGVVMIILSFEGGIREKEKRRKRQMYMDYSDLVYKFTLLLGAGMVIRSAWECVVSDYLKHKKNTHFAYEEMLTSLRELDMGMSEAKVYEEFGKRCALIPYIKFASMLVQNLKKGTAGVLPLLEAEARNAFAERKELSKRMGEEAGTKLQAPLMMYLVIVLIIVLVPAFSSFGS